MLSRSLQGRVHGHARLYATKAFLTLSSQQAWCRRCAPEWQGPACGLQQWGVGWASSIGQGRSAGTRRGRSMAAGEAGLSRDCVVGRSVGENCLDCKPSGRAKLQQEGRGAAGCLPACPTHAASSRGMAPGTTPAWALHTCTLRDPLSAGQTLPLKK